MLFLHVKISTFCAKAHLVFHWCLHNKVDFFMLLIQTITGQEEQPLLAYLVLPQVNLPQSVPVEMEKNTILKNTSGVLRGSL